MPNSTVAVLILTLARTLLILTLARTVLTIDLSYSIYNSILRPAYAWYKLTHPPHFFHDLTDKVVRIQYVAFETGSFTIMIDQEPASGSTTPIKAFSATIDILNGFNHVDMPLILFNGFISDSMYMLGFPKSIHVWTIQLIIQSTPGSSKEGQVMHLLFYDNDFRHRRQIFYKFIRQRQSRFKTFDLTVKKGHMLEGQPTNVNLAPDAMHQPLLTMNNILAARTLIMERSPECMHGIMRVSFMTDKGITDHGPLRQLFFHHASGEMTDPMNNLFKPSPESDHVLLISPKSTRWDYFEFLGRLMALALINSRVLEFTLAEPIYKVILGYPVGLPDLKYVDSTLYTKLDEILRRDDLVQTLDLETPIDRVDPFTNDRYVVKVPVTEENKVQYVNMVCNWLLKTRIQGQVDAIRRGLFALIPENSLAMFTGDEFELLVNGMAPIDIELWKSITLYSGYSPSNQAIQWFWQCVETWPNEKREKLLLMVTGSNRMRVGFLWNGEDEDDFRSCFALVRNRDTVIPCLNKLVIPPFQSYLEVEEKLEAAISRHEAKYSHF